MVKITDMDGYTHYLHVDEVREVTEPTALLQRHGLRAHVRTMTSTIDVSETVVNIVAQVNAHRNG